MHPKSLPLDLYRANAGLQWRIDQVLREGNACWLDAVTRFGLGTGEIDPLLWAVRGKAPSAGTFRFLLQDEAAAAQRLTRFAVQGQIAFTNGVHQALLCWRDGITEAFAGEVEAAPFVNVFRRWAEPWVAAMTATPAEAETNWRAP